MELKRLFIGGLYPDAKEEDLRERFTRYGEISSIEIKKRRDSEGKPSNTFAYISISSTDTDIKKCISTFNNVTWKGGKIRLQLAKEDFLERLEKEREEAKLGSESPEKVKKRSKPNTGEAVLAEPLKDIPGIENFHLKGAPPGPLPGQENWVVAKYGRVLPVVQMKKKGVRNLLKVDPSKLTHNVKRFNEETDKSKALASLTWQMETSDNDITRRRKGDFPEWNPPVKKKKKITPSICDHLEREETLVSRNDEEFEIAPQSFTIGSSKSPSAAKSSTDRKSRSRFDSGSDDEMNSPVDLSRFDSESDDEMDSSIRTDADKNKTSFNVSNLGIKPVSVDSSSKKEAKQKKTIISRNKSESTTENKKIELEIGVNSKNNKKDLHSMNTMATRKKTICSYNAMDEYFSGINNPLESESINDNEDFRTQDSDDEYSDFESFVKAEEKKLGKMPVKDVSVSMETSMSSSNMASTGGKRRIYNSDSDDSAGLPVASDATSRDSIKKPIVIKNVTKLNDKSVAKELSKCEKSGSLSVDAKAKCGKDSSSVDAKAKSGEASSLSVDAKASTLNALASAPFDKANNEESDSSEIDSDDSDESGSETDDENSSSSDESSSSESTEVSKSKSLTNEAKSKSMAPKVNVLQTHNNVGTDKEKVSNQGKERNLSKENKAEMSNVSKGNSSLENQPVAKQTLTRPASSIDTSAVHDSVLNHSDAESDSDTTSDDDESVSSASSTESEEITEGSSENNSNMVPKGSTFKMDQHKQNVSAGTKTTADLVSNHQKQKVTEVASEIELKNLKSKHEIDEDSSDDESTSSSDCEEMSESTSENDSTTNSNGNSIKGDQHKQNTNAIVNMASNNKMSKSELTKLNSKHETGENSSDNESASSSEYEDMSKGTSENDSTTDSNESSLVINKQQASAGGKTVVDNDKKKASQPESEYTALKPKHVTNEDSSDDENEAVEASESDSDFEKLISKEMEKVDIPQKIRETKPVVVKNVQKEMNAGLPAKDSQAVFEEKLKNLMSPSDPLQLCHKSDSSDSDSGNEKEEYKPVSTKEMLLKHAGAASQVQVKEPSDVDKKIDSKVEKKERKVVKTKVSLKEKEDTERKRMEAVRKKQKEHSAKQTAIRTALANVDAGVTNNKKVMFDSDGEEKESVPNISNQHDKKEPLGLKEKAAKKMSTLFDSSSESEDEGDLDITRFNIRPEFEGPGGKKLMKLQSRFGNDERFKLTANFAESDTNSDDSGEALSEDEKTKSLKILQSVVNTDLAKAVDKTAKQKKKFKDVSQLKYDPSKKDHSQFEVTVTPQENAEKKSKKKKAKAAAEEPVPVPEVSKEKFYQVSEAVLDTFAKKDSQPVSQGFSLLAAFGKVPSDSEVEDMETEETSTGQQSPIVQTKQTPSKTEDKSSDVKGKERNSQRDQEKITPEKPVPGKTPTDKSGTNKSSQDSSTAGKPTPGKAVPEKKSSSTFFFTQDDSRLKEGEQFYRHEDMEAIQKRWKQKRPELIQNYKAKQKVMKRRIKARGGGQIGGRGGAGGRRGGARGGARGRGRGGGRGSGRGRI